MSTYADQVRETFENLETEEVLERVKGGTLTAEAGSIAKEVLVSRGVVLPDAATEQLSSTTDIASTPNFLSRCWDGKERLWKAFWLVGLLIHVFVSILIPLNNIFIQLVVALPLQIFWWSSVWRCAFRCSHWVWSILARTWVVLTALITCGLLASLLR
jgi:hypothetical protein